MIERKNMFFDDYKKLQVDLNEIPNNKFVSTREILPNTKACFIVFRKKNSDRKSLALYYPDTNSWLSYPSQSNQYDDVVAFAKIPYCHKGEVQDLIDLYDMA